MYVIYLFSRGIYHLFHVFWKNLTFEENKFYGFMHPGPYSLCWLLMKLKLIKMNSFLRYRLRYRSLLIELKCTLKYISFCIQNIPQIQIHHRITTKMNMTIAKINLNIKIKERVVFSLQDCFLKFCDQIYSFKN